MDWYTSYRLVEDGDGYTLEINLNKDMPEFAEEFLSNAKVNALKLEDQAKKLIQEKFSGMKINAVKFLVGAIAVATIPLYAGTFTASAAPANATHTVTASRLNVRAGPSTSNTIIHALWNGNQVPVIGESGNWYQIRLSDGRTGWVSKNYMAPQRGNSGVVTATKLNVRTGPSTTHSVMHVLWNGNQVPVIGESGNWYQIRLSDGRTGWVSKTYLRVNQPGGGNQQSGTQQKVDKVVATAKSLLGTPYVYGGESPQEGGFDCSGLTQYAYKQAGYTLNRISADQAKQGTAVAWNSMKPGDLVFFSFNMNNKIDHVGIYIGNGQMIHSPRTGDVVKTTNINVSYWQQRFVTAKRIFT
ncbi:MAG TPA: hydrolase [Ruminococcaceae bacterium]|nr:hydrolase [Oscillospiraceae bacterium]HCA30257.1 hydrolase [Oscillospiraceae bacterium]